MSKYAFKENEQVALCEAIDRILNKGAVIVGEATISVANVDLIYLALQLVLTSVETANNNNINPGASATCHMGMGLEAEMKTDEFKPTSHNSV